jgi:hypothetical protein
VDEGAILDPTSDIYGYCPKGQHDLILDEQIGVLCKNCPFVSIEIRYILPAMVYPCLVFFFFFFCFLLVKLVP